MVWKFKQIKAILKRLDNYNCRASEVKIFTEQYFFIEPVKTNAQYVVFPLDVAYMSKKSYL